MLSTLAMVFFLAESSSPVTYQTVAKPVSQVLRDLSNLTGQRLAATGVVAKEPIIVRIDKAPLGQALRHISAVVLGRWVSANGVRVLESDTGKVAESLQQLPDTSEAQSALQREQEDLEKESYSARNLRAHFKQELGSYSPGQIRGTSDEPDMRFMMKPADRLAKRIAIALGPEVFASLSEHQRVAFAMSPAPGERKFPIDVAGLLESYRSDVKAWCAAAKEVRPEQQEFTFSEDLELLRHVGGTLSVRYTVSRDGGWSATATISDAKDVFDEGNTSLNPTVTKPRGRNNWRTGDEQIDWKFAPGAPDALEERPQASAKRFRELSQPILHDPLSFRVSEALLQIAKTSGVCLVATLDDSIGYAYPGLSYKSKKIRDFLGQLQAQAHAISKEGRWVTISPVHEAKTQRERVDRAGLQNVFSAGARDEFGFIERLSKFAYENQQGFSTTFVLPLLDLLKPRIPKIKPENFIFYGSLSPNQQKALLAGKTLRYKDFTAEQRTLLGNMSSADVQVRRNSPTQNADSSGIPYDLEVTCKQQFMPAGVSKNQYEVQVLTPEWLASRRRPPPGVIVDGPMMPELVSPADYRQLLFETGGSSFGSFFILGETRHDSGVEAPMARLPASFFKAEKVEERKREELYRKQGQEMLRSYRRRPKAL